MGDIRDSNEECVAFVLKCTDHAVKYLDGEDRRVVLKDMEYLLNVFNTLENQYLVAGDALEKAKEDVTADNLDDLDDHFAAHLKRMTKANKITQEAMKIFKQKVLSISGATEAAGDSSQDEELVTTQCTNQYLDPITKKQIVNPVRNSECHHVYDEQSIKQMMKKNPRMRCPVVGCANRDFIQASNLQPDMALKLQLSQMNQ